MPGSGWQPSGYENPLCPITEDFITAEEFEALLETANDEDFDPNETKAVIKKEGSKYILYSHKGKKLGEFNSREQAENREREIQFFKHRADAGDTYHNRFAPDRKHNKGNKKFKPLEKKCAKCGTRSGQLDIDHKDGNRKNNNRSNLRYICRSCHRKMHAKRNGGRGSVNTAAFLVKGSIFEPNDKDRALAGHQNQDLMHVKFELCHTGVNKNKDGFITEEMSEGYSTAVNKPVNWEHTNENIGVIYAAEFHEENGDATIVCKAAVWKHKHPERARAIASRFADGDLFFSMETYFQKAKCSVCDDEFESSTDYCEHLSNRMQTQGTVRWLKGLNFVGAGCVANPADVKARGLAVAAKQTNYNKLVKVVKALNLEIDYVDWVQFLIAKHHFDQKKKKRGRLDDY